MYVLKCVTQRRHDKTSYFQKCASDVGSAFSDESHVSLSVCVCKQIMRFSASEQPRCFVQKPFHSEKVTLWCSVSSHWFNGPFLFIDTVNSERYLSLLSSFLNSANTVLICIRSGSCKIGQHHTLQIRYWVHYMNSLVKSNFTEIPKGKVLCCDMARTQPGFQSLLFLCWVI